MTHRGSIAFAIMCMLVSCGGGKSTPPPAKPEPVASPAPAPSPSSPSPEPVSEEEPPPDETQPTMVDAPAVDERPFTDEEIANINTGVPSCDDYMRKTIRCFQHPGWPESARSAAIKGLRQALGAWGGLENAPPESKQAAADACQQAMAAMKEGAEQMCPGVF